MVAIRKGVVWLLAGLLCSCSQPVEKHRPTVQHEPPQNQTQVVFVQTETLNTPVKIICENNELGKTHCYRVEVELLKTGIQWIDDLLMKDIQSHNPRVFEQSAASIDQAKVKAPDTLKIKVYFEGQRGNLVTFKIEQGIYAGPAAALDHETYTWQYYTFDLSTQKQVKLDDLFIQPKDKTLELWDKYVYNGSYVKDIILHTMQTLAWEHDKEIVKYELSDNFAFSAKGIVFYIVYTADDGKVYHLEDKIEIPYSYLAENNMVKPEYLKQYKAK